MGPSHADVEAVEEWLRAAFPGYEVSSGDLPSREVVLFRAHKSELRSPRLEIEISYEAFEDNETETILADLSAQKAAERLQARPEERLAYNRFRQLGVAPRPNRFRPDLALYSPEGTLQMVGEVKRSRDNSATAAASIRRNLLAHGAVPNAPFFLVFLSERLFLWKNLEEKVDSPPNLSATIVDVLQDYLGERASDPHNLGGESLEIALTAWFRDLATATRTPKQGSEADKVIVDSGLYSLLRRGRITSSSAR